MGSPATSCWIEALPFFVIHTGLTPFLQKAAVTIPTTLALRYHTYLQRSTCMQVHEDVLIVPISYPCILEMRFLVVNRGVCGWFVLRAGDGE